MYRLDICSSLEPSVYEKYNLTAGGLKRQSHVKMGIVASYLCTHGFILYIKNGYTYLHHVSDQFQINILNCIETMVHFS